MSGFCLCLCCGTLLGAAFYAYRRAMTKAERDAEDEELKMSGISI